MQPQNIQEGGFLEASQLNFRLLLIFELNFRTGRYVIRPMPLSLLPPKKMLLEALSTPRNI
jgi:hypothetical protein